MNRPNVGFLVWISLAAQGLAQITSRDRLGTAEWWVSIS
jgi:hypothetical protein